MKLLSVLAATAAAAAVAAVLTLPAGADQKGSADPTASTLAACLRSHGAADAPSGDDVLALKQWLAAHPDDPAVAACAPQSKAPAALVGCLRSHGLNPPADVSQLKPWMVQQDGAAAGKAALQACGVDMSPPDQPAKPADCGGGSPAPADKPPVITGS